MKTITPSESRSNGKHISIPPITSEESVTISAPKFSRAEFQIVGTAPYVQAKFAAKARNMMREKHMAGSTAKGKKVREARDFNADYEGAIHRSEQGWPGIPASAFRVACISACRLVGFKMTLAKLSFFVEADGFDETDGTPLIVIDGEPSMCEHMVRNATGVADIRVRAMWKKWSAKVRVRYDAEQFTIQDLTNLMMRVGMQVGIGEGRPDSRESCGMGWGTFEVK